MNIKTLKHIYTLLKIDEVETLESYEKATQDLRDRRAEIEKAGGDGDCDTNPELAYLHKRKQEAYDKWSASKSALDDFENKEWN